MIKEKFHLYTFDLNQWMVMFNIKFIGEFDSYGQTIDKANKIGCNLNHINYEFAIYKTTYLETSRDH